MLTIRFLLNPLVLFIYLCVCFCFKSPIIIFSGSGKMQSSAEEGCGERTVFQTILSGKSATRNLSCLLGDRSSLRQPGLCFPVCSDPPQPAGWMDALEIKFYFGKQTRPRPTSWVCSALPSHSSTNRRRRTVQRVSLAPPAPDPPSPPLPRRPSPTPGRAPAARTRAPAAPEAKVRRWGPLSSPVLASAQQGRRWPSFKGLLSAPHHRVIPPQDAGRA